MTESEVITLEIGPLIDNDWCCADCYGENLCTAIMVEIVHSIDDLEGKEWAKAIEDFSN